jgi:orotidine-5'-phosphate decarboxylase
LKILRERFPNIVIVTPGIRSGVASPDDQARTLSARDALASGASYLVIGRPIIAAADPRQAADEIARSCA